VIVDAVLGLFMGFLEGLISLFPSWSDPTFAQVNGHDPAYFAELVGEKMSYLAAYVNLALLVQLVGIGVTVLVAVAAIRGVLFIYSKFPGKAT